MVESAPLRTLKPAALVGGVGWLTEQLVRQAVPFVSTPFPSPRALTTRIFGLRSFSKRLLPVLKENYIEPAAIVANDHQECPLAQAISQALGGIPVLAILRTPGMTRADFDKYLCDRCDGLMGEGKELRQRLTGWTKKRVSLFEEGFTESEFMPAKPLAPACPPRVIVIGSEAPRKGFTDFIEAIHRLEARHPDFPGFHCDFTGSQPSDNEALLARPTRSSFHFLGRVEGFANLVRQYDLAVHPSRAETFGMAPVESLLAGTPTLVSVTGIVGELALPAAWTFPPGDSETLSHRLAMLWQRWLELRPDIPAIQTQIRGSFHIDHTAAFVREELQALGLP